MALELIAPAKLNLTLEVLGKRPDGYHEIASVMQTIDLVDRIYIERSERIELEVGGPEAHALPTDLEANLAYRAAIAMRDVLARPNLGVRILLDKQIPAGAGLGGGSSDAAAVLRGLNRLWDLGLSTDALAAIAARLGSDVPFFLYGGTALVSGRGEVIEPLPDIDPLDIVLFVPPTEAEDKTQRMYALLDVSDFSDGSLTQRFARQIRDREPVDVLFHNVFDRHIAASPAGARALVELRVAGLAASACGSGPAVFALAPPPDTGRWMPPLATGLRVIRCRTEDRAKALALNET